MYNLIEKNFWLPGMDSLSKILGVPQWMSSSCILAWGSMASSARFRTQEAPRPRRTTVLVPMLASSGSTVRNPNSPFSSRFVATDVMQSNKIILKHEQLAPAK